LKEKKWYDEGESSGNREERGREEVRRIKRREG
jgi:hypothetical protein